MYVCMYIQPTAPSGPLRSVLIISTPTMSNRGSQIPEPLLVFTSKCPWKLQISQGLGPLFHIELLKTGRKRIRYAPSPY